MWHTQVSQSRILTMTLRQTPLEPFKVFPLQCSLTAVERIWRAGTLAITLVGSLACLLACSHTDILITGNT
jgi:hypothetical protein